MEQSKAKTPSFLVRMLGFGRKGRIADIIESEGPKISQQVLDARLAKAIQIGKNAEIKRLLKQGADANTTDKHGWTLLHHAASKGNAKACKLLVKHGADADAMTESTNTPLCLAKFSGSKKAAEFLESVGGRASSYV